MTIKELQHLWEIEKNAYQTKEIGSGVQTFVKKVLQSSQLFNLHEGKLSTADIEREQEFLEEQTKKQKRADIVIFINHEIIIPVEVERFGNIQVGEVQLFQYQLVWDKKNGILTDGNKWIFYISKTPIKSFFINDILNKPTEFLIFWNEYTQPINYYLNFFTSNKEEENLNIEKNRQNFFTDITTLINNFTNKLNLKGYFNTLQNADSNKQAIEISYAYLIQFILYKTLVDNDFVQFKTDFTERQKRILQNLSNQNFGDILTVAKAISNQISTNIYRPFKEEQNVINKKIETILDKPRNELHEVSPWLDIFVFVQRYNFANIQNEIFGFIYENYLKQLYDEKLGQYFTSPEVTDFMLEQIGYSGKNLLKNIEKDAISIIDPSCGSGTFLYGAVRNLMECVEKNLASFQNLQGLVTQNVFGLDVSEFPLYLAEMSIIMRMLPLIINEKYNNPLDKKLKIFKTKDTVSEFLDTAIRNTLSDTKVQLDRNKGQMNLFSQTLNLEYDSFIRDKSDLEELKRSLENQTEPRIDRYRFDYVIGNPPYISYNECSTQGVLIFNFIKQKLVKLNDIFGVNLHSVPDHPKKYAPKPNLYAFFIATGLALLKDGGKMCYIIPQTILTEPDYDVLRYHLAYYTTIEKIIIFKSNMFTGRGLQQKKTVPTSSLIFVLKKHTPNFLHETEIIVYKNSKDPIDVCLENIRNKKHVKNFKLVQKQLQKNCLNWNFLKQDTQFVNFYEEYCKNTEDLSIYYEHKLAEIKFGNRFYIDGGNKFDKNLITENSDNEDNYEIVDNVDENLFSLSKSHHYYSIKNDIKYVHGAQGIDTYLNKYKVVWRKLFFGKFHFSERKLILHSNNYLGIFSDNRTEIIYLFALLNSPITRLVMNGFFMLDQEKYGMFMTLSRLKNFIRVPLITEKNQFIKDEIIQLAEKVFDIEASKLSDFVDFSQVIMQKFDSVSVSENYLQLRNENQTLKCKIKSNLKLVEQFITNYKTNNKISLNELKSMPCVDNELLNCTIQTIDNLVFTLYFNIPVTTFENVNSICDQHPDYQYIFKQLK